MALKPECGLPWSVSEKKKMAGCVSMKAGLRNIRLEGLFSHLCASTGLYSKETFLSLYGCVTRMLRDHRLKGFVMTRTLDDPDFETVAHAMEDLPGIPFFCFNQPDLFPQDDGFSERSGFLLVLTDRLCATLYWSEATHESFRMYAGGWTFHPGDTRTIAAQLIARLQAPELEVLLNDTAVDRRYDDKLNLLTTALVQGLEQRNRDLTVALDQVKTLNKKNVDTERMAAIGQLSSVIAHEIRNPLGLIDLYAKLTEDQMGHITQHLPEEALAKHDLLLKNLSHIRQATSHLETILSELSDYSRPLQLNLQSTDIHKLMRDVCDFVQPSFREKSVKLTLLDEVGEVSNMQVDADRLRQAMLNLLKNALEACPADKSVTVKVVRKETQVAVEVADEGSGIAEAHVKKLFTPYFSTKGTGTGLGLAHSRKILQAHGGSLELIASAPGVGTTFALVMPGVRPA